jgi:enoyl-CoA hydratase
MAASFAAEGPVGLITLDQPPANSYDIGFMRELGAAIGEASADEAVRVVVLRSASEKFFSAGADVKRFLANDADANMEMIRVAHEALASIARSPKLFVAWIAGHALGGGLEIALACDVRYAVRAAFRLGTPEVTLGLLPGNGGTQRLPRIIGKAKAMEMILLGQARMMDAQEAERCGMVSRIVPAAELVEDAVRTAQKIAELSLPIVMMAKESVNRAFETTLNEGVRFERRLFHSTFATEDQKEGMAAFAEKRKPQFKNR